MVDGQDYKALFKYSNYNLILDNKQLLFRGVMVTITDLVETTQTIEHGIINSISHG